MIFADRLAAGCRLGRVLLARGLPDPVVVGVWRDSAPVAAAVAHVLHVPLEICIVRELFAPGSPASPIGAVAEHGGLDLDEAVIERLGIPALEVRRAIAEERAEATRLGELLRDGTPLPVIGRHAIVVDDALTTLAPVRAVARALRAQGAATLTLAVPVANAELLARLCFDFEHIAYLVAAPAAEVERLAS